MLDRAQSEGLTGIKKKLVAHIKKKKLYRDCTAVRIETRYGRGHTRLSVVSIDMFATLKDGKTASFDYDVNVRDGEGKAYRTHRTSSYTEAQKQMRKEIKHIGEW